MELLFIFAAIAFTLGLLGVPKNALFFLSLFNLLIQLSTVVILVLLQMASTNFLALPTTL